MKKKKKLLWIGDDIRFCSGVATQLRELILGLVDEYDICVLGGAMNHPEAGKIVDLSQATQQLTGVKDAYVRIYPVNGYGDENILFAVMQQEQADAVCMITDPRYFTWLFNIERQVRVKVPIIYWALWDDLVYPRYNFSAYKSCDAVLGISRQSDNIHKQVLGAENCCDIHGNEFTSDGNKK
jgi:hypothetical protein